MFRPPSLSSTRRPGTLTWAALMTATAASWALGTHHAGIAGGARAASVAVLVIAFVKVLMIGLRFMELHRAPRALTALFTIWAVVVCAVLVGLYLG